MELRNLILDVDGVMTDGGFYYSASGKVMKRFGPEDADALKRIREFLKIHFVTADSRGSRISEARIRRDLGYPLDIVESSSRLDWIRRNYGLEATAYMADSFVDVDVLTSVRFGIAPANAAPSAKRVASYVTTAEGGKGAVAEACFYLGGLLDLPISDFPDLS